MSKLGGRSGDRHQTLPHVRWWPRFTNVGQKFGGRSPKTSNFQRDFSQFRDLKDIVNGKHRCKLRSLAKMLTKFGELWSQTAKNK